MASIPTTKELLGFINSLSTVFDAETWWNEFKASLGRLLPEIDELIVSYNILHEKHRTSVLNRANVVFKPAPATPLGFKAEALQGNRMSLHAQETIAMHFARTGRSREQFHEPIIVLLRDPGDDVWIGTLILLREREKSPFSPRTFKTLEAIEPFLVFAMTERNIRHQLNHPADVLFFESISQITEKMGLTRREMRVLMFRLLGRSYKEIGGMLGISPSTVKNHLSAVHTKAGVHTQSELFARYFAPQFGLFSRLSESNGK